MLMKYRFKKNAIPSGTNEDRLRRVFEEKELYEEVVQSFPFEPDFINTRQSIKALYGRVDELSLIHI